uniref:TSA: Wollemia nobilis Ref_Wollemi_Transcript_25596_1015 transcribed RNA sequence n=1 Tax=Wollemia nobilis TaxID=56998 RepID=A0A0C9S1E2_9CONI
MKSTLRSTRRILQAWRFGKESSKFATMAAVVNTGTRKSKRVAAVGANRPRRTRVQKTIAISELPGNNRPEKKGRAKAPRKPRAEARHPSYYEMVVEAVATLKERRGSSRQAIAKYIAQKYAKELPENFKKLLNNQLRKLIEKEKLIQVKGCYKLAGDVKKTAQVKTIQAKEAKTNIKRQKTAKPKEAAKSSATAKTSRGRKLKAPTPAKATRGRKPKASTPATAKGGRKPKAPTPAKPTRGRKAIAQPPVKKKAAAVTPKKRVSVKKERPSSGKKKVEITSSTPAAARKSPRAAKTKALASLPKKRTRK